VIQFSNNVGVNLHVAGTKPFRVDTFDNFTTVKLETPGRGGVAVFISNPADAYAIAVLFREAAIQLEAKLAETKATEEVKNG
jgi:hypothetical protein